MFTWVPTRAQAATTNVITLKVTDDDLPPFRDTGTFTVRANDYVKVFAGETVRRAGEEPTVPLDFHSSASLSGLSVGLRFDGTRLGEISVEELVPERASVSLRQSNLNSATVHFTARPGQTLQGSQQLDRLHFKILPEQVSAFVPLTVGEVSALRTDSGLPPASLLNDGRVVVIGDQPLLEARRTGDDVRELVLYGRPGVRYTLDVNTNKLAAGSWETWRELTMTNLFQRVPADLPAASAIFYRARE